MIDPTQITNFNLSQDGLEEHILFWILAAGKNGVLSARLLDRLLQQGNPNLGPFASIKCISDLPNTMKSIGIGCYNNKSATILDLISKNLNLKTCSVDDLESIKGIGPKTARCFLIHSRENQRFAGLDTHALKFLRSKGYNAPKSTPVGKKYKELEKIFIDLAEACNMSISDFDLQIWNQYRK